jgi:hypothetical protein
MLDHRTLARRVLLVLLPALLVACGQAAPAAAPTSAPAEASAPGQAPAADLSGLKAYLVGKTGALIASTAVFRTNSDRYYELAKAANFDYAQLWKQQQQVVGQTIAQARGNWISSSPTYEQMEGIVAGTPSLAQYDVILDAGLASTDSVEEAVPFDLTLPDGRVLPKPGNLFGVLESTLWGTNENYIAPDIWADYNANGSRDFGETLPDANVLTSATDALDRYANDLHQAAQAWQPVTSQAFAALVDNIPTVTDFFESWKDSRFVAGDAATRRDFVVVSRLSDIVDNVSSWQVIYQDLSPSVRGVDAAQDAQINEGLASLKTFVGDLYAQEQGGKRFSPEEAELLSAEAGNRATAIAGQVAQVAAKLNIPLQ